MSNQLIPKSRTSAISQSSSSEESSSRPPQPWTHQETGVGSCVLESTFWGLIWFTSKNFRGVSEVLDGIFHQARRLVTGLFKQTPLVFLKKSCRLRPLTSIHLKNSHFYVPQALTYPKSHPMHPILRSELTDHKPSFPSPLHSLLAAKYPYRFLDEQMEIILPSPIPVEV